MGDPRKDCRCSPGLVKRYRARSASLAERIDLHVEVPAVTLKELQAPPGEPSQAVARRVSAARSLQLGRFGASSSTPLNAQMDTTVLRRHCALDPAGQALLSAAVGKFALSAAAVDRTLKVARTIADLAGGGPIRPSHLAEAIQYRSLLQGSLI